MNKVSRRNILAAGLVAGAGASLGAAKLARRYGLIPPDCGGVYGIGETLNYATHRVLTRDSPAREFRRDQISNPPFANEVAPMGDAFNRSQGRGFDDWRLEVTGSVARPASFSVADLKKMPTHSQITEIACEEGWSYIAEWIGVPLSHILGLVDARRDARHVVYHSKQEGWWDSIDMAEALHPQTLIAHGMNGGPLPVPFGGPLRMRVPRQLGYKSLKYVTRLTLTDNIKSFRNGLGSGAPEAGYAWYAGI